MAVLLYGFLCRPPPLIIPIVKETNIYLATTTPPPEEPSAYPSDTDFSSSSTSSPGVSSILPPPPSSSSPPPPHDEKYLLYFSQAGFANQHFCLRYASIYARALNRTLLLPPVLPWAWEPGRTSLQMVRDELMNMKTKHDNLTEPELHYLKYLPEDRYLPLKQVIDIDFALPDLRTLDVRDFFHRLYYPLNLTKATIEIDYGYSVGNTAWVYDQPKLSGTNSRNQTYRDLVATFGSDSEHVLVLLDAFQAPRSFHWSIQKELNEPWRPRLAPAIREAVRSFVTRNEWPPYAAVHVRTSDNTFRENRNGTIPIVFERATKSILEWFHEKSMSGDGNGDRPETIGLYVATDAPSFQTDEVFLEAIGKLTEALYQTHGTKVRILSRADAGNVTDLLGGMLYADLFWDLQAASSAQIAFEGSIEIPGLRFRSTFSKFIRSMREFNM